MNLSAYLDERRAYIETHLFTSLPALGTRPVDLTEALHYAVESGGKRIRPILCLAAAEAVGGVAEAALAPAIAIELLHTYTLVHDDLPAMDNDLLRRGKPTVHAKYGEARAILVGDALQALAFGALVNAPTTRADSLARLIETLARYAGPQGVVGGQVEDIAVTGTPSRDAIEYIFEHKCADLFCAACRMGALCGGGTDDQLALIDDYAWHLGFAFQIVDDILDAQQAKADTKPEFSCLALMSEDDARAWAHDHTQRALCALDTLPGQTEPLEKIAWNMVERIK